MIRGLGAYLNGAPIDDSNNDYSALAEIENADEAITAVAKAINEMVIYLK